MNEKKNLITEYITEDECNYNGDSDLFDCENCSSLEECYMRSCVICDIEYAESIDYGGCDSEESFWEQFD